MKVEVHIERLVLDGSERANGAAVGAALQEEFGRLIAERGLYEGWERGGDLARLSAALPPLAAGSRGPALGRAIAGATFQVLHETSAPGRRGSRDGAAVERSLPDG